VPGDVPYSRPTIRVFILGYIHTTNRVHMCFANDQAYGKMIVPVIMSEMNTSKASPWWWLSSSWHSLMKLIEGILCI
jgi:hypothetical protein